MPMFFSARPSHKPSLPVFREYLLMYAIGSVTYTGVELLFRGRTHFTMVLTGGLCLLLIHATSLRLSRASLLLRAFVGSLIVTAVECLVGCFVNRYLGWEVWDYSNHAMNLWGQICPLYSFYWFLLSIPAVMVSDIVAIRIRPCLAGALFFGKETPTIQEVTSDAEKET